MAACRVSNTTDPINSIETGPGSTSNTAMLTVDNPVPTITEVSPRAVEAGVLSTTLIVTGTDFISGTVLRWNGPIDRPQSSAALGYLQPLARPILQP